MNDQPSHPPVRVDRPLTPTERPQYDSPVSARLLSSPLVPTTGESDDSETVRTVSDDLNRELLRGAHARIRERQKNKGYSAVPDRKPEPEPLVISNKYIPPSRDTGPSIPRGVTNSVFEFGGNRSETGFDDIPDVTTDENRAAQSVSGVAADSQVEPSRTETRIAAPVPTLDWTTEQLFDEPTRGRIRVEPSEAESHGEVVSRSERDLEPRPRSGAKGERTPLRDADLEAWDLADGQTRNDNRGPWAAIPRCCQTCRDFRPAGNGQRGWCNNQWAFRHRRMVDALDIPCETSVGNWWIPGDEAWQGEFDISALGQPTPLMDKWFGQRTGDEESADGHGERRRRRTGSW